MNNYADADDIGKDIPNGWWLLPPSKKQTIELHETEGIEKQLNLMERFKSSFVNTSLEGGEQEYDRAVREMLNDLPFMKKRKTE